MERLCQQRGFAGPGAGDQVQDQLFTRGKAGAVACCNLVVFIQNVDFHLQHLTLAEPRRVGTGDAMPVMQVARSGVSGGEGDTG